MPYDLKQLTAWAIGLSWIYIAGMAVLIVLSATNTEMMQSYYGSKIDGSAMSSSSIMTIAIVFSTIGVLGIANYVVSAIWLYQATSNARAIDPDPARIGPGWSVGWFCIPIANFWMPFRAVKQIWNTSLYGPDTLTRSAPGFFAFWWAAWLIADVLTTISLRVENSDNPASMTTAMYLDVVVYCLVIASALFWIRILRQVRDGQESQAGLANIFE